MENEAFCMFFERLSEENDKVSKSLLGTVPDGVKTIQVTASSLEKEVDMDNTHDGPELFQGINA